MSLIMISFFSLQGHLELSYFAGSALIFVIHKIHDTVQVSLNSHKIQVKVGLLGINIRTM